MLCVLSSLTAAYFGRSRFPKKNTVDDTMLLEENQILRYRRAFVIEAGIIVGIRGVSYKRDLRAAEVAAGDRPLSCYLT